MFNYFGSEIFFLLRENVLVELFGIFFILEDIAVNTQAFQFSSG